MSGLWKRSPEPSPSAKIQQLVRAVRSRHPPCWLESECGDLAAAIRIEALGSASFGLDCEVEHGEEGRSRLFVLERAPRSPELLPPLVAAEPGDSVFAWPVSRRASPPCDRESTLRSVGRLRPGKETELRLYVLEPGGQVGPIAPLKRRLPEHENGVQRRGDRFRKRRR